MWDYENITPSYGLQEMRLSDVCAELHNGWVSGLVWTEASLSPG